MIFESSPQSGALQDTGELSNWSYAASIFGRITDAKIISTGHVPAIVTLFIVTTVEPSQFS